MTTKSWTLFDTTLTAVGLQAIAVGLIAPQNIPLCQASGALVIFSFAASLLRGSSAQNSHPQAKAPRRNSLKLDFNGLPIPTRPEHQAWLDSFRDDHKI